MSTFGESDYGEVGGEKVVEYSLANHRWTPKYIFVYNWEFLGTILISPVSSWRCWVMGRLWAVWRFSHTLLSFGFETKRPIQSAGYQYELFTACRFATAVELGGRSCLALILWKDTLQRRTGAVFNWSSFGTAGFISPHKPWRALGIFTFCTDACQLGQSHFCSGTWEQSSAELVIGLLRANSPLKEQIIRFNFNLRVVKTQFN